MEERMMRKPPVKKETIPVHERTSSLRGRPEPRESRPIGGTGAERRPPEEEKRPVIKQEPSRASKGRSGEAMALIESLYPDSVDKKPAQEETISNELDDWMSWKKTQ